MPKFHLNENAELVAKIREGLQRTGGYCPCRLQRTPENRCICEEFKHQLEDPDFHGACHCGLYVKD
ncbi:MAG: ferredoxin thioredoxin reductase catalytic beta chain [Gemmiger sp.]